MSLVSVRTRQLMFTFVLWLFWSVTVNSVVAAKSYTIDAVEVRAFLEQDGSLEVEERREFNFEGDYRFVYQTIGKQASNREQPYELSGFSLCDEELCYQLLATASANLSEPRHNPDQTLVVVEEAERYYLQWHFQAVDERKIFTLRYKVANAVTKQADIAELYWQWLGADWEVPQTNVTATLYLPKATLASQLAEVQAFGHGPLTGQVSIAALPAPGLGLFSVQWQLPQLPVGKFLEGRVLLPPGMFVLAASEMAAGTADLQQILAEEAAWISAAHRQLQWHSWWAKSLAVTAILLLFLGLWWVVAELRKFWHLGKDAPLERLSGVWEPPTQQEPAVVWQLLHARQTLHPKVFTATVLSLVHHKLFRIIRSRHKVGLLQRQHQYFLERSKLLVAGIDKIEKGQRALTLAPVEQAVYQFLTRKIGPSYLSYFDAKAQAFVPRKQLSSPPTTNTRRALDLQAIATYIRTYPSSSYNFFKSLEKTAMSAALQANLFDKQSHAYAQSLSALKVLIVVAGNLLLLFSGASLAEQELDNLSRLLQEFTLLLAGLNVIFFFVISLGLLALQQFAHKRTPQGRLEASQWQAFRRHLQAYRKTQQAPIDSIILWERYLIYGTLFGVALKTLAELPVKFSAADVQALSSRWAVGSLEGLDKSSSLSQLSSFSLGSLTDSLSSLGTAFNGLTQSVSRQFAASGSGSSGGFSGGGGGGGGRGGGGAG